MRTAVLPLLVAFAAAAFSVSGAAVLAPGPEGIKNISLSLPMISRRRARYEGEKCSWPHQCKSFQCSGKRRRKRCTCLTDKDCRGTKICVVFAFYRNECRTKGRLVGDQCNVNRQCESGRCQQRKCRCFRDHDCGDNEICAKYNGKHNTCRRRHRKMGEPCQMSRECDTGRCEHGQCVCGSDEHCPFSEVCVYLGLKRNACRPGNRFGGEACLHNKQCFSGKCKSQECTCDNDTQCKHGFECAEFAFKPNACRARA